MPTQQELLDLQNRMRGSFNPQPKTGPSPIEWDPATTTEPDVVKRLYQQMGQRTPAAAQSAPANASAGPAVAPPVTNSVQPMSGPPQFQVPTASIPYASSQRAQLSGTGLYTPEQIDKLETERLKNTQEIYQDLLNKSYQRGQEQTGIQGTRDMEYYLGQVMGSPGYNQYASPQERLVALQLQNEATKSAGGQMSEGRKLDAARALKEMELSAQERISKGSMDTQLRLGEMQFGDGGGGLNKQEKRDVLRQANQAAYRATSEGKDPMAARNTFLEMNGLDADGNPLPAARPGEIRPYAAKMSAADLLSKAVNPENKQFSIDMLAQQFNALPAAQRDAAIAELKRNPQWGDISKQLYEKLATAAYKSKGAGLPPGYSLTNKGDNIPFGLWGRKQVLSMPGGVNFEFDPGLTASRGFDSSKHQQTIANLLGLIESINRSGR